MIGTKFNKPLTDFDGYATAADWANENGAMIVDQNDYYEVVTAPELPLAKNQTSLPENLD